MPNEGCACSVTAIGAYNGISELTSNYDLVYCVCLRINAFGQGVGLSLHFHPTIG